MKGARGTVRARLQHQCNAQRMRRFSGPEHVIHQGLEPLAHRVWQRLPQGQAHQVAPPSHLLVGFVDIVKDMVLA